MASLIDSLIQVLNNENTEYSKLLDLSKDKTSAIVGGNVEKMQEIFSKEQKLIDELNKLEEERMSCVTDICKVLHLSPSEVKVEQIVKLLEKKPKEHDALEDAYLALKRTVNLLASVNDNNKILLQQSMDMIEFEINLARNATMNPQTGNYGKGAYEESVVPGRGSFDAKQ